MSSPRIPVAILGATGMVGQRMLSLLTDHPFFEVVAVAASARSAGRPLGEAASWLFEGDFPPQLAGMTVRPCAPEAMPPGCRLALSALDAGAARTIEADFRAAGFAVLTNASPFRMDPDVPLLIPEVNPDHLDLIHGQPGPGFIIANPNCGAIPVAMALAPLHRRWGVEAVVAATWQAISGAGYPGEAAMDIASTVHPHPGNEEDKLMIEPQKILGSINAPAAFPLSPRCVRVPTIDGHLVGLNVRLRGDPSPEEVAQALADWPGEGPPLPSCPRPPLRLSPRRDRPSPRHDAMAGGGMAVTIGRIERCPILGVKLYALAHNTIRGAAGAAIANAELLVALDKLPRA